MDTMYHTGKFPLCVRSRVIATGTTSKASFDSNKYKKNVTETNYARKSSNCYNQTKTLKEAARKKKQTNKTKQKNSNKVRKEKRG